MRTQLKAHYKRKFDNDEYLKQLSRGDFIILSISLRDFTFRTFNIIDLIFPIIKKCCEKYEYPNRFRGSVVKF